MANTNIHSLVGVSSTVQLGKNGPKITSRTDSVAVKDQYGGLMPVSAANPTEDEHLTTKEYVDSSIPVVSSGMTQPLTGKNGDVWIEKDEDDLAVGTHLYVDGDWVAYQSTDVQSASQASEKAALVGDDALLSVDSSVADTVVKTKWSTIRDAISAWVVAKTNTWTELQIFSGGAQLGDTGLAMKMKVVSVVMPAYSATLDRKASAPHGLDRSKIRSMAVVANTPDLNIGPGFYFYEDLAYDAMCDDTDCTIESLAGKGADVAGATVYFTFWYIP